MFKLLKPIQGFIYLPDTASTKLLKSIEGAFGDGDYFKVFDWVVFQQDFSRATDDNKELVKPTRFGLQSNSKRTYINLEINF
tara:strand:+ start:12765 stop:13010 length:246 start_codon:yes stop_codon:yes gene_type:complete